MKAKRKRAKGRRVVEVIVQGGMVANVKGLPKGMELRIMDYDIEGVDEEALKKDKDGDEYNEVVWL